ncbi:MAG: mannose-6-phosphate isomerase-like protein [Bacteroidetes bacterium OLB12]|nr:MAG: mannose-6-phosphate isomerase-like protein [Bacteroidetes bacterium OLB12]HNR72571.1 class I mannose-6-phosphate isomerase [Cyclobacteriaceae bacterium]HNU41050.1 class I mannose-6-phosphate isomerase [Cyclobacteriaceae bacterium]
MSFNKFPSVKVTTATPCLVGWAEINQEFSNQIRSRKINTVVIECYQGVYIEKLKNTIAASFAEAEIIDAAVAWKEEAGIRALTHASVTDDRIFGFMTNLNLSDLFDASKVQQIKESLLTVNKLTFVIGTGASLLVSNPGLVIYADMARWEIQLRMRRKEVANVGLSNFTDSFETQYKRGFFLDWRLCDNLKKQLLPRCHYILDTNNWNEPKLITYDMLNAGLTQTVQQPFSVVPFFDPGPWGGQWMKEKFNLDKSTSNFAWCFNCVPEENSLLLDFNGIKFETPSINLVLFKPLELLGKKNQEQFGDEFPIRFDFLDTIEGGNLSLQVHPLPDYIKKHFGMKYTQDESYYILDATEDALVYLGLKENVNGNEMIEDLRKAQSDGSTFDADKYAQRWPAKKHDHFLIPAGTVHCSAAGCMVLEISATPYIFTFKLWDWGRLGLDGKPRPINIEHGANVIQWDRQPAWTKQNLINRFEAVSGGAGWKEEKTGLHELEFIETRRYRQTEKVTHHTNGDVNVLMIVDGKQAVVECPHNTFEAFVVNYAEAFVIPAQIKEYTIRPYGPSQGEEIVVIKAFVRH